MVSFHDRQRARGGRTVVGAAGGLGLVVALSLSGTSGAQAQNCALGPNVFGLPNVGSSPAGLAGMIGTTLASASTAFLLQSTAFIGSPPNPGNDQQGGGIWVRGVGGTMDMKTNTYSSVSLTPQNAASYVSCEQTVRQTFAGVQVGTDIARLNVNGWNVHAGVTAGYMQSKGSLRNGAFGFIDQPDSEGGGQFAGGGQFTSSTKVPFLGAYAAATYGGFFIDGLIRSEYYQTTLNAPGANLYNQALDARGLTFAASTGYNWRVPNSNWFIEPSAGVIISRVAVDPFNYITAGTPGQTTLSGTLNMRDIYSNIGRVGVRAGTTVDAGAIVWQPFAAVSVWHEFGPNISSLYETCPSCVVVVPGNIPTTVQAESTTTTFGTYGQYSLGFSAALAGTGWLGFARGDYRKGANVEGYSGTGGIRYQFTPEAAARMPVKARSKGPAVVETINWSGFYVGAFGAGVLGSADWNFANGNAKPSFGGTIWGGEVGFNVQNGVWVYGLAADIGAGKMQGSIGCGPLVGGVNGVFSLNPMFQMTCHASATWLATATARIGVAWDRALAYVKGGGAWTNLDVDATCNLGPLNGISGACANPTQVFTSGLTAGGNRFGGTVGFGTEFALTRTWSAKAEYNYIVFGNRDLTASDGSILNIGMNASEVRVGLNYRFDGGAVVARY